MQTAARSYGFSRSRIPIVALFSALLLVASQITGTVHAAGPNLLANGGFETPSGTGPTTLTAVGTVGASAAANWAVWNNSPSTTTTELVPSTAPNGGSFMLHVTTTGSSDGIFQPFLSPDTGPTHAVEAAWVYVVRGQMGIGTGNGGNTGVNRTNTATGHWELLFGPNGVSPANEFIAYATSAGGAEFYIDNAAVLSLDGQAASLYDFPPSSFQPYFNSPVVQGNIVVLRSTNPACSECYQTGVGVAPIPQQFEQQGSVLQWGVLACSPTATAGHPTTLNIGVQSGHGDENSLSVRGQLNVTNQYTWLVSAPAVVDAYKPNAYFYIPGPLGQEILVRDLILGDPASVAQYIASHQNESGTAGTCTPPTDINQCKNGGWQQFNNPSFKNQGQCIAYVNHANHSGDNADSDAAS